jgi:hypothetical protein
MVALDQHAAVEAAHRVRDDVNLTVGERLVDSLREHFCSVFAAVERSYIGETCFVLAGLFDVVFETAKVVDYAEHVLRNEKAAREDEIHMVLPVFVIFESSQTLYSA